MKSEIEKNLKFTIEQNIVEINRLKALVDEANDKQKQEQFAIQLVRSASCIVEHLLMFASVAFICHVMKSHSYSIISPELIKSTRRKETQNRSK